MNLKKLTVPKQTKTIGSEAFGYYRHDGYDEEEDEHYTTYPHIEDFTVYCYTGSKAELRTYQLRKGPELLDTSVLGKSNWQSVKAEYDTSTKKWITVAKPYNQYTNKNGINSIKINGLKSNTKYKFRIRAYYINKGKNLYSEYSDVKTLTTKA